MLEHHQCRVLNTGRRLGERGALPDEKDVEQISSKAIGVAGLREAILPPPEGTFMYFWEVFAVLSLSSKLYGILLCPISGLIFLGGATCLMGENIGSGRIAPSLA